MLSFSTLLLALAHGVMAQDCNVPDSSKVDCGDINSTQDSCIAKGCCWQEVNPNPGNIPWCFYTGNDPRQNCYLETSTTSAPFNQSDLDTMTQYFLANINIQGKGGVVASPDTNTPGGSYYYHWERDGALSMGALLLTTPDYSTIQTQMQSYVQWVLVVQNEPDPNGIDVRVEPKYNLPNGDVYSGGWCRPQTDGPALRASTQIQYANLLLSNGDSAYVKKYLWTGDGSYNGGTIYFDLAWVVKNWQQNGCDLWEEVQSTDFFWNRYVMYKALMLGSDFATKMGDSTDAATYQSVAQQIYATLSNHYVNGYVYESLNRLQDSAVILAFNNGYLPGEKQFAPNSEAVAGTVATLTATFCSEYAINQEDTAKGIPGVLYGRYPGDSYAGGNPWILTSCALAQLLYDGAAITLEDGHLPSEGALRQWSRVLGALARETRPLEELSPLELATAMLEGGDSVLLRVREHVQDYNWHLSEQIDRNTGAELGAYDLTWSYATALKAMYYRGQAINAAHKFYPKEARSHPRLVAELL